MNYAYKDFVLNKNGNTNPTPVPTEGPSTTSIYRVKSGDCLSAIGSRLGVNWKDIASANGIKSPYIIYVGQSLVIQEQIQQIQIQHLIMAQHIQ